MKTQHTPGPWKASPNPATITIYSNTLDDLKTIATAWTGGEENHMPDFETAKANARLIAAAPELLKALNLAKRALKELAGAAWDHTSVKKDIEEAIAKATGKEVQP